nr:hypothetical protein CFP56_09465 [Quercus suber]
MTYSLRFPLRLSTLRPTWRWLQRNLRMLPGIMAWRLHDRCRDDWCSLRSSAGSWHQGCSGIKTVLASRLFWHQGCSGIKAVLASMAPLTQLSAKYSTYHNPRTSCNARKIDGIRSPIGIASSLGVVGNVCIARRNSDILLVDHSNLNSIIQVNFLGWFKVSSDAMGETIYWITSGVVEDSQTLGHCQGMAASTNGWDCCSKSAVFLSVLKPGAGTGQFMDGTRRHLVHHKELFDFSSPADMFGNMEAGDFPASSNTMKKL